MLTSNQRDDLVPIEQALEFAKQYRNERWDNPDFIYQRSILTLAYEVERLRAALREIADADDIGSFRLRDMARDSLLAGPTDVAPAVPTKPWMPDRYLDESGDTAETPAQRPKPQPSDYWPDPDGSRYQAAMVRWLSENGKATP